MFEEKEKNKTICQNANSVEQNTVDKTTDILKLASTIGQDITAFLNAKVFVEVHFSAVNLWLPPFSDSPRAQSEILSIGFDLSQIQE
jgi:predicted component of type VI protein secretion system